MHYLLIYETASDYLERRAQFRAEHLQLAWDAAGRGELVLAGAAGDPIEGAILLFKCNTPEPIERFAAADPFVTNGLVTRWRILPWHTVVGLDAANPVRPAP